MLSLQQHIDAFMVKRLGFGNKVHVHCTRELIDWPDNLLWGSKKPIKNRKIHMLQSRNSMQSSVAFELFLL